MENRKLINEELGRPSIEEYKAQDKTPIAIILDNVRSLHNVGTAFRTGDAFAVHSIALCGITAQPPHREINKTALGATDSVDWLYFDATKDALTYYKNKGFRILAVEQAENSLSMLDSEQRPGEKMAFVFGHEVEGVQQTIVDLCDACIEIPQLGTKHSLNISVSIGVVLWHHFAQIANKQ